MKAAFFVLLAFAAAWGAGSVVMAGLPRALLVLPLLISGALAFGAGSFSAKRPPGELLKIRKLVRLWSAVEGIAIVVAVLALGHINKPALIVPAIAVLVGLHFIPLARGFPQPKYYATAAAMIAGGVIAAALPKQVGPILASATAALALWATAISLLLDTRRRPAIAV
jgi:hypothetical protein